jgi:hypothetical protein
MGVPKIPTYSKTWKTKRQTRIKPSGMTRVLEKYDTLWKNYDPQAFLRDVMGTGSDGLRDIQRNIDGFQKADAEISDLAKTHAGIYDKDEKAVIKKVLDDIAEEITFWKDKKKVFVLEEGGADLAEGKLKKIAAALDTAMDTAEARGKQLAALHGKLSQADKYADHRHPPAVLETFRKGADDFEKMLREIDEVGRKFDAAADKVGKAYASNAGLATEIAKMQAVRVRYYKRLKELWGDRAVWTMWVAKELAASPA